MGDFKNLLLGALVISAGSVLPAFAMDECTLDSTVPPQINKEVQEGCTAVTDAASPMGCCKRATEYIKKNAFPCSDDGKLHYQIDLALTICGKMTYGSSSCVDAMAYKITDARVQKIDDDCLTQPHEKFDADCQNSQLKALRKQLDIALKTAPTDAVSCSNTQGPTERADTHYPVTPTGIDPATDRAPSSRSQ